MKRIRSPKLERETWEEQNAAGRHNPCRVLVYKGYRVPTKSGGRDTQVFFANTDNPRPPHPRHTFVYCLCYNWRYGYVGLQGWDLYKDFKPWNAHEEQTKRSSGRIVNFIDDIGYVFFQNLSELPDGFEDWSDKKMFDHLIQYLP